MLLSSKSIALLKSNAQKTGGLEKHTLKIHEAFEKKGWEVFLLTTGDTPSKTVFPKCSGPSFYRIRYFDKMCSSWLQTYQPKVAIGMDRNRKQTHIRAGNGCHRAYLASRFAVEGFSKKLMCKMNPLHRTILDIERSSFEDPKLNGIITNSHMVKNEILSYYNVNPKKIFVIHNGVEHGTMEKPFNTFAQTKDKATKEFNIPHDRFHFLFIGNGFARKGLLPLLKALAQLRDKNVFLSVVGKDKHTDYFKNATLDLGIEEQVRFFGPRLDILNFYSIADALVIPSYYDPFANVTVEALAMGLFVVSSKTNGGSEILSKQGAIIEDLASIDSICDSLKQAMKHKKTPQSARIIRNSVAYLDFSVQLEKFVETVLKTS